MHNSNCTAPDTCVCSSGYNGSYCQYRKFGFVSKYISFLWSLAICPSGCLNGGNCVSELLNLNAVFVEMNFLLDCTIKLHMSINIHWFNMSNS